MFIIQVMLKNTNQSRFLCRTEDFYGNTSNVKIATILDVDALKIEIEELKKRQIKFLVLEINLNSVSSFDDLQHKLAGRKFSILTKPKNLTLCDKL